MKNIDLAYFWFRRDLRLNDNHGLWQALNSGKKVIPVFIFDTEILNGLEDKSDRRVAFIHETITDLQNQLRVAGSDLEIQTGSPLQSWKILYGKHGAADIYTNRDYEPYAISRDKQIASFAAANNCSFFTFKDQVVRETDEVVKEDKSPYSVYTPYSKKWRTLLGAEDLKELPSHLALRGLHTFTTSTVPTLHSLGFSNIVHGVSKPNTTKELLHNYADKRDIPSANGTSRVSVHLRFGTVSVRQLFHAAQQHSEKWLNELVWREFYMQILWHFPQVVHHAFKLQYDRIVWRNNESEFDAWCHGKTGYPIVDSGMRELNETGFMHNRVRMIVASFLTKHLLIDWRWGEAYFAQKLLDFELSSNNGGWQWAVGCGVDAAPYFRIFNPYIQTKKFDPELKYIRQWLPEFDSLSYPKPIVDHEFARKRCLEVYAQALGKTAIR